MTAFKNLSQPKRQRDFLSIAGPSPQLSFVCVTELALSVQGILKAGVHLFFILTGDSGWMGFLHDGPQPRFLPLETFFSEALLGILLTSSICVSWPR